MADPIAIPTLGTDGANAVARRRLQSVAASLGETDVDQEVELAARLLRRQIPNLPDYSALSDDGRAFYDLIVGLSAAIHLLGPAIAAANDGMAKLKTPEFEYTFSVPALAERDGWSAEIAQAFNALVQLVRVPAQRVRRGGTMFGAAGIARQRERCDVMPVPDYRLLLQAGWLY